MAKRSKRHRVQQNKDQVGCMGGLISIFDFRHGRTTRRLLSDKRIMNKSTIASTYPTSEVNMVMGSEERHVSIENLPESEKPTLDVIKTSVKELMEEEMVSEQDSECDIHESNNQNHTEKTSKKSCDHEISQYNDLEALMKEILMIYQRKNDRPFSIVEEKLSAAVEVFMNEKTKHPKDKDLIDMFQMLSSNKELFLKLLQDQASLNSNEDQKSKSKSNPLGNESTNPKLDVPVTRKHLNFFRKRSKSQESISLNRIVILKPNSLDNKFKRENDVHSDRISSQFSFMEMKKRFKNVMGKEQSNEKTVVEGSNGWSSPNRDHFYTEKFTKKIERVSKLHETETKKKENNENGDVSGHISNIYIEAKKHLLDMLSNGDEDANLMIESIPKTLGNIISLENEHGFVTTQMRLSSRGNFHSVNESQPCMDSVDLEEKPVNGSQPCMASVGIVEKSVNESQPCIDTVDLENIPVNESQPCMASVGLVEKSVNESQPCIDTVDLENIPVNESQPCMASVDLDEKPVNESRPCIDSVDVGEKPVNDGQPCMASVDLDEKPVNDSQPCMASVIIEEKPVNESQPCSASVDNGGTPPSMMEDLSPEENQEEMEVLGVFCNSPESINDEQHGEIVELSDEERSPRCWKSDSPEENEFSSPMGSSSGRPSPVSVLESLFSDNEISPASTICRPVESTFQPLCIKFEDQEICSRNHMENEESAFEYIEAVLLASDLNWNEFEKRWLSSIQILDSSLFDEVEIFSSRPLDDQRLLFDSTNEILKEVCDCYLDFFLQLSFIERKIQPVPKGVNLINVVWERIELHSKNNYPLSLDHLVKKDLRISRTWMDLRDDSREIVFEIDELIFEDMMDDTLLSFVNDCVDKRLVVDDLSN